jgi:hypothetical protein
VSVPPSQAVSYYDVEKCIDMAGGQHQKHYSVIAIRYITFFVLSHSASTLRRKVISSYSYRSGLIKIIIASYSHHSGLVDIGIADKSYRCNVIKALPLHTGL